MRKIVLATLAALSLSSGIGFAADDNNCGYLSIAISNNNPTSCTLVRKDIRHGNMSSGTQVPGLIPAGGVSFPFELSQTIFGPSVVLTYQCADDQEITFESQQNLCFLSAGNITGTVYSARNMRAFYTSENGSYWWSSHGFISWTLAS